MDAPQGNRHREWNWRPDEPVELSPLFAWPPRPLAYAKWLFRSWFFVTERLIVLILAFLTWFHLQPALERCVTFRFDWIAEMYLRNMGLMIAVAGGLHLYLYTFRRQDDRRRFDTRDMARKAKTFTLGSQVRDNMLWTLASGVTVWTGFEVLMTWGYANGYMPYLTWDTSPIWFVALFLLQPIWGSFHFYWIHRFLHWPPLYRLAHSVHHRNINIGPWSGMSMHPVEHILYLSSGLIHCIVASHPVHMLFHMQVKALEAATSHSGYESLLRNEDEPALRLGDFFHQMHHRYFECNYGTLEMPWDRWFGSFHDGSPEADTRIRERRIRIMGEN